MAATKRKPKSELQQIPGVGPSIEIDLMELGFPTIASLRGQSPQKMYDDLIRLRGQYQDRCVLYVFREVVYFAETPHPDPELLKWWRWKDEFHTDVTPGTSRKISTAKSS